MKKLSLAFFTLFFILLSLASMAADNVSAYALSVDQIMPIQEDEIDISGLSLGVCYNQNATPQFAGWGSYDKLIAANIYSYSGYDVMPLKTESNGQSKMKFTPFTGFAYRISKSDNLSIFVFGAGGVSTTGDVVTGAGKYGGFGHYRISKRFGIVIGGEGSYSPINGTDAIFRTGLRFAMR